MKDLSRDASLTLALLLGPVVALMNQGIVYAADSWACGHGMRGPLHIIPALCLLVAMATTVVAYRNWAAMGHGVEDERGGAARVRFMALGGVATGAFSSLIIVAEWAALFVFGPCMRA